MPTTAQAALSHARWSTKCARERVVTPHKAAFDNAIASAKEVAAALPDAFFVFDFRDNQPSQPRTDSPQVSAVVVRASDEELFAYTSCVDIGDNTSTHA